MQQTIVAAILNEGAWLTWSMALGFVVVGLSTRKHWHALPTRVLVLSGMNRFYGCMIGTMAAGHLLAVTIKAVQGTLEPSLWLMYLLGLVLAVPAWWLAAGAYRPQRHDAESLRFRLAPASPKLAGRLTSEGGLNAWLGISLLGLGPQNLPLAAPAALNLAYQFHSRRAVGWTIASVAVAANLALFVGSLIFWASGQTFEQFRGME